MNRVGKELKRLSRRELVDIIYQLKKNEEEKQKKIDSLTEELQDKRLKISMAGSVAEAAMSVTNVFSAAQMTADMYLNEIFCMKEEAEKSCAKKIEEAEKRVEEVLLNGEKKLEELKAHYKNEYVKCQQLQNEIAELEQKRIRNSGEDAENG